MRDKVYWVASPEGDVGEIIYMDTIEEEPFLFKTEIEARGRAQLLRKKFGLYVYVYSLLEIIDIEPPYPDDHNFTDSVLGSYLDSFKDFLKKHEYIKSYKIVSRCSK